MNDLIININKKTRQVELTHNSLGNDHENLQENLVFVFDEFVNGQARLEYIINDTKNYLILNKQDTTYTIPVKNVITIYQEETIGKIQFQLVITEGTSEEEIPVFKSNIFYLRVRPSINAVNEAPEGYDLWIEQANAKLNTMDEALTEVDNLDVDVSKENHTTTITITKKDGTTKSESIEDTSNDFTDEYKAQVDANTLARHTHSNKAVLDGIDASDISSWNGKAELSDIPDVTDFITKDVNNLTYYTLATNTGATIELSINSSTYVMTLNLKNSAGTTISTGTIDLPLESVVVGGSYDSENKKVVLTLQNGSTIEFSVADLISGLQAEITSSNKLASDLVDDTNQTNKFVTTGEKTTWDAKYDLPSGGIPKTDLSSAVQTSLGKADTALQEHQDISGKVDKVTGKDLSTNDYTDIDKSKVGKIDSMMADLTATGTSISTTKSADWYGNLNVEGFSRQNTRSGKNILNVPSSFSVTGNVKKDLALTANTQYKVSFSNLDVGDGTVSLLSFLDSTNNQVASLVCTPGTKSYNITPSADITAVRVYSRGSYNGSIDKTAVYTNLMVRLGSITDDTYEPYGVSPSPDYPSEIRNLKGATGNDFLRFIQTKGNLFDKNNPNIIYGYLNNSNVITYWANNAFVYIPCEEGSTYIVKKTVHTTGKMNLSFSTSVPDVGTTVFGKEVFDNFEGTITAPTNANYLLAFIYNDYDYSGGKTVAQILEGLEIYKIENTIDFPLQAGQKMYEDSVLTDSGIKNYKKQVDLSTFTWTSLSPATKYRTLVPTNIQIPTASSTTPDLIATKYNAVPASKNIESGDITLVTAGTDQYIYIMDNTGSPSGILEYRLVIPEIIEYTPEQQAAYNKLKNLPTFQYVNNISLVSNEEATMTLNYKEDLQTQLSETIGTIETELEGI